MSGMSGEEEFELLRCLKGHVIKTYKNGRFTDLTIKSKDGVEIRAHKLVLYAQNAWFARKLETDPDLTELALDTFSGEVLRTIVDSIYYRKMSSSVLTKENVLEYLKAGQTFHIDHIRDEAAMFMAKNLDVLYALDMIQQNLFSGSMADAAMVFITENFQRFLSDEKLKKRILAEIKVNKLSEILRSKSLMLWDSNGRYLQAVEREKQLFFFILGYIAQDKEKRMPELKELLRTLRMSLLVSKNIVSIHVMGAGLKAPTEEISGMIADIIEPFEGLKPDLNLASLTHKDSKDKAKSVADLKFIAESSRMRYGTIPHQCVCSDLVLKLEPWSQTRQTKIQFVPDPQSQKAVCSSNIKCIVVYIQDSSSRTDQTKPTTKDKSSDETENSDNNKDQCEADASNGTDNEASEDKASDDSNAAENDAENKEKESKDKSKKDKEEKKTSSEKASTEKASTEKAPTEKAPTEKAHTEKASVNNTKEVEEEHNPVWRLCGISFSDGEKEESIGCVDGKGIQSKSYELEKDEFITEISALFSKEKVSAMDGRGKRKEAIVQEMFSMTTVEDLSFKTSKERTLGPILQTEDKPVAGLIYRLPKQIFRLEKGSPSNFWWLQGFGMEKDEGKMVFYPIWKFQSAYKYYPLGYQGLEFVAGVKKQMQFSIHGVEECLELSTIEDLDSLEKTPVHEVVDLDDSDEGSDEAEDVNEEDNEDNEGKGKSGRNPNISIDNEDSVMIVDSESEDDLPEEEEEEFDEEDEYQQGVLQHEVFAGMGGGSGGMGLGGVGEPIEIPSSSDEDENDGDESMSNGKTTSSGKRRKENSEEKSPKRKK